MKQINHQIILYFKIIESPISTVFNIFSKAEKRKSKEITLLKYLYIIYVSCLYGTTRHPKKDIYHLSLYKLPKYL